MYASDDWKDMWESGNGTVYPTTSPRTARVVEKQERVKDHYGEYIQGEDSVSLIFEVVEDDGNKRYFKKEGYCSSYGDFDWSWGGIKEVFPKTKTVTVWE